MQNNFHIHLICPYCHKGEALADGKAKVTLSIRCPKCGRFYTADLDTMQTEPSQPLRRVGRMR